MSIQDRQGNYQKYNSDGSTPVVVVGSLANIPVDMATALDKDIDSIDIGKMSNGAMTVALNAIVATTTSAEISVGANGYKHVAIYLEGSAFTSGNFALALTGSALSGGSFGSINRQVDAGTYAEHTLPAISTNANFVYIIPNIGVNFLKITATRTTDGTLTARVVPFN